MSKKLVLCDLDGILNLLYPYWLTKYGIDNGMPVDIEQIKSWELTDNGFPEDVYRYLEQPGFFKYAPPMPFAIETVKRLQETGKFNIVVYTACQNKPHAFMDKATWLDYWLPFLPVKNKIIGGNYKHFFAADIYIDDSPRNQLAIKDMHPEAKVLSIRWPYNDQCAGKIDLLAHDYREPEAAWDEIETFMMNLV